MTIKFISEYQYSNGDMQQRTTVEIPQDSSLITVVEAFEQFLKGAGYMFDGHLDIVEDTELAGWATDEELADNSETETMPSTTDEPKYIYPEEDKLCHVCGLTRGQLGIFNCYDARCGLKT